MSGFIVQSCHTQPGINMPFILGSYVKLVFGYPSRARVPQGPHASGCFAWTPAAAKPPGCSPAHRTYPGRSVLHIKTTLGPHPVTELGLFFNLALCVWSISTPSASLLGTTCNTSRYTQRAQSFVQGRPHVTEQREAT